MNLKQILAACAAVMLMLTAVQAAQTSWKGTSSASWATSGNWTAGVPTALVDAIIGDANFTGTNQPNISATAVCLSLTLGAGTKTSTLTVSRSLTVSGNITLGANGKISHTSTSTSRVISLKGDWLNSGVYTGSSPSSSVTFSGTAQSIGGSTATGFRRLNISAGSIATLAGNISVTNTLAVSGTFDPGAGSGFVVSGVGTLSVANGGKILVRASTFGGNYANSGTKTLSAGNTVDYAASGNQTVTNLTYSTLRISGSGVKSLAGNLPSLVSSVATAGNIEIAAGTLDLSTFTANRGTSVAGGTISVAAGATLKIGGTGTFPANYGTHALNSTSTVEYGGANQTVSAENYGHLTLSGTSGAVTKTMPAGALSVAGNLTASQGTATAVSFTAGGAFTVGGNVDLGVGTAFSAGSYSHSIGGNWVNNGTFTGSSSTITMNGVNTAMSGVGTNNFNNLVIARSGITAAADTSLTVAGNFSTSGAGTFNHTVGGAGTVTMSGTTKTLSGTGITFSKLTLSGSISTAASFTVADNLTVNGSLTSSAGTLTLSGTGKTISGSGTIAFSGLRVTGTVTTGNSLSLSGNLSVIGSFTATAGTTTFTGTTTVSGTASLFNTTLNGTLLQMGADSILGLAGTTTLTAGTFDVTSQRPNTVIYNSAGSQTVYPITYDNLEIAGGGTKTAGGNINVRGDLIIDSGAVFSGASSSNTISVRHHWLNHGTFNAGDSTVEMVGPNDSTIDGATTFNQLRVSKDVATLNVNFYTNNLTVANLDMASGTIDTLTNTLTLTSTRTGNGHVLGTLTRQHSFTNGVAYAFEGPFTTITFDSLTSVSSVTVATAVGAIPDFPSGAAVNRQYLVSLGSSGAYNATFRAYYQDTELNGNVEASMELWKNGGSSWALSGKLSNSTNDNWVEKSSLTDLAGRWTMSANSGVVRWNGSASTAWETADNWTVVSGSPSQPPSANDIVELGTATATYQPTISSSAAARSISFGSAQAMTLTLGAGGGLGTVGIQTVGNVGGEWTNTIDHIIEVGAQTLSVGGDLTLSDGTIHHTIALNVSSGTVTVANDLVQSGGASIIFTGAGVLNLGGDFRYTSGTFTAGSGTVNYTGSNVQTVAGVTYHHLVFNKTAGIATLPSATTVNGNVSLATGGRVRLDADLDVAGNVTIGASTTLDLGGRSLHVGGDWICNGTLNISSGGEVVFDGTGDQTINTCTFHDFDIEKPSGTATLAGNVTVAVDADVYEGTLDLGAYAINSASIGTLFSLAPGTKLRTAGSFPTGFSTILIDPASTVEYYGAGTQTIAAETYGNLVVTHGASNAKTLAGPITVAGNLLIDTNATLAASSGSLTLQGNWTNLGTFAADIGTVVLSGTNKAVAGNTTFSNLTVLGSYTAANCNITIAGNITVLGSYTATNGTTTLDGNLNNTGTLLNYGTLTFTGTRVQDFVLNSGFLNRGTVNFNGSVRPVLHSTTRPQHQIVNINNTAGVLLGVGWDVYGALTVNAGASWNGSGYSHMFYGTLTNHGTVTSSGTLNFSPTNAITLALGTNFSSTGIVIFSGANQITLGGSALALNSVEIANSHSAGITPVSNWTLTGDLQIHSGATFHAGSYTHKLAGNLDNQGTLEGGTSTMEFNGASELNGTGSTLFHHLKVSSSLTNLAPISVTGDFTNNGLFDAAGAEVRFTGSSAAVITGTTTPTTLNSFVIAKNSATVALGVNLNGVTSLIISSGTLDTGTYSLSQNATDGGSLSVGASGILKLGGANAFPTFSVGVILDPASTVNFSGAAQAVAAITYANLILSGSGDKTLSSTTTVNGNVEINGTAKFNLNYAIGSFSPVGSLTFGGVLQTAGTWGSTSSSAANKTNTYFQNAGKLNAGNRSLDHFAVTTPGTETAGTSFSITTLTAQDADNNTLTTFFGTVDLTETGEGVDGTVTPSQSSAFSAGVLSGQSVTLTKAGAAVTITVADHAGTGKSGVSDPFTVNPGALHHYAVTFSTPPFQVAVPFNTIVTAQDANDNRVTADSSTVVVVSSDSPTMGWDAQGEGEWNDGKTTGQAHHITRSLTSGVAIFSTRDTVAETTTITANSTGPTITGTSASIEIEQQLNSYRSKTNGNWGAAGTWDSYNGSAWVAAGAAPSFSAGVILIQDGHTVTVAEDVTVDQVHILSGGRVNVSSGTTLTVGNATNPGLEVHGSLTNAGTLTFTNSNHSFVWDGGVLQNSGVINSTFDTLEFEPGSPGGKYRHEFTTTEGTIPTAEWEEGSVCEIVGYSSNTTTPGGLNQSFHDFTWNCPSQTGTIALGGNLTAVVGDFTVTNTGSGAITLGGPLAVTGSAIVTSDARLNCGAYAITGAAFTLGSGGTLGIGSPDGILSSGTTGNIQTTTRTFSTDGNYIYNGAATQSMGTGLPDTVNNLVIANSGGITFDGYMNASGAFTVASGSLFRAKGTLNGPLIVNGTLAAGNSIGTLITGTETWNGGGTNEFEINDATGTAGVDPGWDWLDSVGNLDIQSSSGTPFTIKVVSLNGGAAGNATNFNPLLDYRWHLATVSRSVLNFSTNKFTVDATQFQNGLGGGAFSVALSSDAKSVDLVFTPLHVCAAGEITASWNASGMFLYITLQDAYGLGSVVGLRFTNCTVKATAYGAGDAVLQSDIPLTDGVLTALPSGTTTVITTATKIHAGSKASFNARAYDLCGSFSGTIDPVNTLLEIGGSGETQQTFTDLFSAERFVGVQNGTPGLRRLSIVLNGHFFILSRLSDGESRILDVGAAMNPGMDNTMVLVGEGPEGASAVVTVADTLAGNPLLMSEAMILQLQVEQNDQGLQLSWPETGVGLVLQSRSNLDPLGAWVNWPTAPVWVNGRFVMTVSAGGVAQCFRLHLKD